MLKIFRTCFHMGLTFLILCILIGNSLCGNEEETGRRWASNCWKTGVVFNPDDKVICTCTGFLVAKCVKNSPSIAFHPLDPLSPDEVRRSKNIILRHQKSQSISFIFNTITLKEPSKSDLLSYFLTNSIPPKGLCPRKSMSILWDGKNGRVYEAVVNLDSDILESLVAMPQNIRVPLLSPDDDEIVNKKVISDPQVIQRCLQLGVPDTSLLYTATWPIGYIEDRPEYKILKRPYHVFMYFQNFKNDNAYAHPLPFVVVVDLVGPRVIALENLPTHNNYDMGENQEGNSVPKTPSNYDYTLRPSNILRRDVNPILVSSPEGPSYKVTGNLVEWQKFKLRLGFNAREGLILYNVVYDHNGKIRPIIYRASLAEMGVMYGDPRPIFHRKFGFDQGDIGLGWRANKLNADDCLGTAMFINATVNNNHGDPVIRQNAICITEEDAGILWKHQDFRTGKSSTVRSHRLVVSFTATTGNYDLSFSWMFYQDASIQYNLKLTGIVSTNMMSLNSTPAGFGSIVFPQVDAQFHQHLVALRLDTEIDGNKNSVEMQDVVHLDAPTGSSQNPYGQGLTVKKTLLRTQLEGVTKINPSSGRVWVVTNPNKINPASGTPVGWKLMPSNEAKIMMKTDSPIYQPKLGYLLGDMWVTRYQEDQLYAGGFYFNNSGLPEWVNRDLGGSILNTDVVLWHMFNPIHIVRTEDFPVMPVEHRDVWLKPYNFFLENPGLDVPPPSNRMKNEL